MIRKIGIGDRLTRRGKDSHKVQWKVVGFGFSANGSIQAQLRSGDESLLITTRTLFNSKVWDHTDARLSVLAVGYRPVIGS